MLIITSCTETGTETEPAETADLASLINNAGEFEDFEESYEESEAQEFEEMSGNVQFFCTRKTVNLTEGFSDYPQFDPNSQVIFPGNLLQGNTLDNATPSGIPVERGPGTIVITLVNGASSASRQLEEVGLGSVFDAMNEIIADNPGDLPARTTYSMERISSREQLGVSLRAEYNSLSTDVQEAFSYESDVSYNRFLVRLTQSYYTIAFEAPTDPADFLGQM
jgi:thiol-activated cytolysin